MITNIETKLTGEIATLGTKLTGEIATLGTKLTGEIATLGNSLRSETGNLGVQLRADIGSLKAELVGQIRVATETQEKMLAKSRLAQTLWTVGTIAAGMGIFFALLKIFPTSMPPKDIATAPTAPRKQVEQLKR